MSEMGEKNTESSWDLASDAISKCSNDSLLWRSQVIVVDIGEGNDILLMAY